MTERKGESLPIKEQDPQATNLWIIRHGPTQWNVDGQIQGQVDNPLLDSEILPYLQRMQVDKLPKMDRIVTSDFRRAMQTAEHIRQFLNWGDIPSETYPALRERSWGIFEGKTHREVLAHLLKDPEIIARYPEIERMKDLSPIIDAPGFKVEGSESMDEVRARVTPVLLSLREKYPGETILVGVHAGVIISQGLNHRVINNLSVQKTTDQITLQQMT